MAQKGTKPVVGQACVVTKGTNKGKKGKYTKDIYGDLYCEGDWGATGCKKGGCKPAAKQSVSVFEYETPDGTSVSEVEGVVEGANGSLLFATVVVDAVTGATRNVSAIPIRGVPVEDLCDSESDIERCAGRILADHLSTEGVT